MALQILSVVGLIVYFIILLCVKRKQNKKVAEEKKNEPQTEVTLALKLKELWKGNQEEEKLTKKLKVTYGLLILIVN